MKYWKKAIHHIRDKAIQMKEKILKLLSLLHYKNTISLVNSVRSSYVITFVAIAVLAGIIINWGAHNKLPYFIVFQMSLLLSLCLAYISIKKVLCFQDDHAFFAIHSASEPIILREKTLYTRIAYSDCNYIFPIIFGAGISITVAYMIPIPLDPILKLYCFSALGIILAVCATGFLQYIYFIFFLLRIAKGAAKIKRFDNALPAKTNWLVDLATIANRYSIMYFLVGAIYVSLFYVFSFNTSFGNMYMILAERIPLYVLWGIIIAIIIVGFPITTFLGLYALRKITIALKEHQEEKLRKQKEIFSDAPLQVTIDSLLILLSTTPDIPQKPLISYLVSFLIGTVNLAASLQALSILLPSG